MRRVDPTPGWSTISVEMPRAANSREMPHRCIHSLVTSKPSKWIITGLRPAPGAL